MVRKHPEVFALAVLTLFSIVAASHPLPTFQLSSDFPDAPELRRLARIETAPKMPVFRLICPNLR